MCYFIEESKKNVTMIILVNCAFYSLDIKIGGLSKELKNDVVWYL
jgi:hypothetical protein